MKNKVILKYMFFIILTLIVTLSCTKNKVDLQFKSYYYMHMDSLKISVQDKYGHILLDSIIDTKKNINVRFFKTIYMPSGELRIKVNTVDTLIDLLDYEGCEKLSVEFNNMYIANDTAPIMYNRKYEKVIIKSVCK